MAGTLRNRNRRIRVEDDLESNIVKDNSQDTPPPSSLSSSEVKTDNSTNAEIEIYAKEVLHALIDDNLSPTPNNFYLYFDRLLEDKSEHIRRQIMSMLELEESNDKESTIKLENSLKEGFSSIKNILNTTANLYKNMSLMTKILDKRRKELADSSDTDSTISITIALDSDIVKLNTIVNKQSVSMKSLYNETAGIIKNVENETIYDNKFGVYNKRYLMSKVDKEIDLVKEFNYESSLLIIELSRDLKKDIANEKVILLMTKTMARLLLKTSRRSDIVSHYGNGVFAMLMKHTDIQSAKKASERLCYIVSNSNFFLADREVQLKVSIGITDIDAKFSVEEILSTAMNGVEKAYQEPDVDYAVELLSTLDSE